MVAGSSVALKTADPSLREMGFPSDSLAPSTTALSVTGTPGVIAENGRGRGSSPGPQMKEPFSAAQTSAHASTGVHGASPLDAPEPDLLHYE